MHDLGIVEEDEISGLVGVSVETDVLDDFVDHALGCEGISWLDKFPGKDFIGAFFVGFIESEEKGFFFVIE